MASTYLVPSRPKLAPIVLVLAAAVFPPGTHAAFEEIGFGARAMGMADAVTAVGGDLSALGINPAALGQARHSQLAVNDYRLFNIPAGFKNMSGFSAGAAVPLDAVPANGSLGVSWSYDNVDRATLDRALALTYATHHWRELGLSFLDVGISLKHLLRHGRELPGHSSVLAGDLGAFLRISDDKTLGLSILNVNSPRTSMVGVPDRAPFTIKAGYAQSLRGFLVAMDLTKREPSVGYAIGTLTGAMGAEYAFATAGRGTFSARTGLTLGDSRSISWGIGWRALGISVDYALRAPLSKIRSWSNAVSLSYRFGSWDPEGEYERMLAGEVSSRKEIALSLQEAGSKQAKLAEELKFLREELAQLRQELAARQAEKTAAQERLKNAREELRLKELEAKREEAQRRLERLQKEQEELRLKDKKSLFAADWRAYQELKRQGVSEDVLVQRLNLILRQYKGTDVDLGEANLELRRLLRQ